MYFQFPIGYFVDFYANLRQRDVGDVSRISLSPTAAA